MIRFKNLWGHSFGPKPELPDPGKFQHLWSISIYRGSTPLDLRPSPGATYPVLTRDCVSDAPALFVADPFMIVCEGMWYMFFEVMNGATKRGEIGVATSADALHWKYEQIVLREPFHLSYPFVFEWNRSHYLVPESHKASAVRLYKARQFPLEWHCVGNLLQGEPFADTSLFHYNDLWWLFSEVSPRRAHDTLRLYYSQDLTGPWTEHPRSPVMQNNSNLARPAGRVLQVGPNIFRFAQVCSPEYGMRVKTVRITDLTPTAYVEEEIEANAALGPSGLGWNAQGMHHVDAHELSPGNWIACVDGWRAAPMSEYMKPVRQG